MWYLCGLLLIFCGVDARPNHPHGVHPHAHGHLAQPDQHIVGGGPVDETTAFAMKYQVALLQPSGSSYYISCGGTWVDDHNHNRIKVVTAAHCVHNMNSHAISRMRLMFGANDTVKITNGYPLFAVTKVTSHPQYNDRTLAYDVAVIIINNLSWHDLQVTIGGHTPKVVDPIPIADSDYYDQEPCWVSGYGTLWSGGPSPSSLHVVEKPLWSHDRCKHDNNMRPDEIDETMLCSGETGKDACQGDSGGPLVVYRQHKYKLQGIVSWGYGCGAEGYPGVYADANFLRPWIEAQN